MGKTSNIIAVIALIVSLGAGGFIVYDSFFAIPPTSLAENQWFDFTTSVYYMPASEAWGTISGISIDFDVSSGQNVYFSFIAEIDFNVNSYPDSYVEIHFEVDGFLWSYPQHPILYVERENIPAASAHDIRMSVSLQHYNTTMTSGPHTVTLVYRGDSTADSVRPCSLFVQTFN